MSRPLVIILVLALAFMLLKALPVWPEAIIKIVSPNVLATYATAGIDGWNESGRYALGIDAWLAVRDFLRVSAYITVFVLVLALVTTRERAFVLMWCVLVSVVFAAVLGLVDYLMDQARQGRASGPFGTNANLFAGLLELGIGLAIGLLYLRSQSERTHQARSMAVVAEYLLSWKLLVVVFMLVLLAALFSTGSRGGALSILLSLVTVSFLLVRPKGRDEHNTLFLGVVWTLCILSTALLGANVVLDRVGLQGSEIGRLSIWKSGLEMFADYPLFGTGGGSWRYTYAQYRELVGSTLLKLPLRAHNDYIQMLAEHGIIGFTLFGAFIFTVIRSMWNTLFERRDPLARSVALGTFIGAISLLFHATVDGNFQVTTTMTLYFAILSLGVAASKLPPANMGEGGARNPE